MIIAFAAVFVVTYINTSNTILDHIEIEVTKNVEAIDYHILSDVSETLGIIGNIKTSVEKNCKTEKEISDYIFQ